MQILIFAVNHHVYNALTYDTPFNNLVQHGGRNANPQVKGLKVVPLVRRGGQSTNTKVSVEALVELLMDSGFCEQRRSLLAALVRKP